MKREVKKYDFKAFGQAIKAARKSKGISRNQLADQMHIAPRYIASIENSGQHPSLQIFYELVTLLDVSVDHFFFPNKETDKSTQRRQLESAQCQGAGRLIRSEAEKGILTILDSRVSVSVNRAYRKDVIDALPIKNATDSIEDVISFAQNISYT